MRRHRTSRLPHVLTSSTFLRAAACRSRDSFGQAQVDLACRLDGWLQGYVDGHASVDDRRAHVRGPLAGAILRLNDVLGAPGAFEVDLQRHIDLPDARSDRLTHHRMRVACAF